MLTHSQVTLVADVPVSAPIALDILFPSLNGTLSRYTPVGEVAVRISAPADAPALNMSLVENETTDTGRYFRVQRIGDNVFALILQRSLNDTQLTSSVPVTVRAVDSELAVVAEQTVTVPIGDAKSTTDFARTTLTSMTKEDLAELPTSNGKVSPLLMPITVAAAAVIMLVFAIAITVCAVRRCNRRPRADTPLKTKPVAYASHHAIAPHGGVYGDPKSMAAPVRAPVRLAAVPAVSLVSMAPQRPAQPPPRDRASIASVSYDIRAGQHRPPTLDDSVSVSSDASHLPSAVDYLHQLGVNALSPAVVQHRSTQPLRSSTQYGADVADGIYSKVTEMLGQESAVNGTYNASDTMRRRRAGVCLL